MPFGDDYTGDEWLQPSSARETQVKFDPARATRGLSKRPQLENSPWKAGDVIAGFELIRAVGCGSHGWVYQTRELATGKTMALKVFPAVDPHDAVRAKTGFRRMSRLRHHGLVRLYRILQEDDVLAFSMELIEGENLVHVLRRWKNLPLQEACNQLLEMLRQVGAALAWTHAHQLVHRDIKPTNLMLTADGSRFVIVDCDLTGEFESDSDPQNIRGYLIWTPMYVAPEVLFRQSYCPASDIFSLGMVALEALRMFSSAQRRRDRDELTYQNSIDAQSIDTDKVVKTADDVESATESQEGAEQQDVVIPRDEQSIQNDCEHIVSAFAGLHVEIPELLVDTVNEMLSREVADRPTAASLSRLGRASVSTNLSSLHNQASTRAHRLTGVARVDELVEFRRWSHLVLGGQVQRLHIDGSSGIGKSTFLNMAVEELRLQSWPLVFVARCQRFEHFPLQAFSQIADEIVIRFRRGGLEKISVDSVSESILQRALPGFDEILEVDWSQKPVVTSPTRPGGLEAAMKVCNQLRQAGPVFFVIDDVQWADRDTVQVLDYLQTFASHQYGPPQYQGLGLITVSRTDGDRQHVAPDARLTLGPLPRNITTQAIRSEAKQHALSLTTAQLDALNDRIDGQPYRLDAYLSELSPAGLLHDCLSGISPDCLPNDSNDAHQPRVPHEPPSIEEVWQHRSDQLNPCVAELLNIIVIAGRQITFEELRAIEKNPALLETQLDELAENRLIVRDGFDGQYVRVWHDRLAQQLLTAIALDDRKRLHRQWAASLASNDLSAARIAEHYEKAGDIEDFLVWAKQAAQQAHQLYAHIEAARWHRSVAQHSTGDERRDALRNAAESLQRGGRLSEAAPVYGELSATLSGQAKVDVEIERVQCFIRSGHFAEAIDQIDPLLHRLKLPRRKRAWQSKLSIVWNLIRQSIAGGAAPLRDSMATPPRSSLQTSQITACRSLVRPLSLIDNWLAAELNVFNRGLVRRFGGREEQIELTIGTAVFRSYHPGPKRQAAARSLSELEAGLTENDSPATHGDLYGGMAWAAAMGGRFSEVPVFASKSRDFYASSERHHGFEIAHTSFAEAMARFHLGDLSPLCRMVDDMQAEGTTTNDHFVLAMGSLGFSSVAFLMRDNVQSLQTIDDQLQPSLQKIGEDSFAMASPITSMLRALYLHHPHEIEAAITRVQQQIVNSVVYRVQIIRTMLTDVMATASLSQLPQANRQQHKRFCRLIALLRRQKLDFADAKADLLEGIAIARCPERFARDEMTARKISHARLTAAAKSARTQQLKPAELAALDELARLNGDDSPRQLNDFLREQGVVKIESFARLYRGVAGS
jgi:serine/threonine protein kinase